MKEKTMILTTCVQEDKIDNYAKIIVDELMFTNRQQFML